MNLYQLNVKLKNFTARTTLKISKYAIILIAIVLAVPFDVHVTPYIKPVIATIIHTSQASENDLAMLAGVFLYVFLYILLYNTIIRMIDNKLHQYNIEKKKYTKGFSAEKEVWKMLKYLKAIAKQRGIKVKIDRNIVLSNRNGKKFDIDFILYCENKKIVFVFECKSYTNFIVHPSGAVTITYDNGATQDSNYTPNPKQQLLNAISTLKESSSKFIHYYVYPVVVFPYAKNYTIHDTDKRVYYLTPDSYRAFESMLMNALL